MYIKKAIKKPRTLVEKLRSSESESFKRWIKASCVLFLLVSISAVGLKLTNASFATRPTGTLDIVTYEGSVTAGREIGSVNVSTDQGGSTVQCSPKSGTTDPAGGSNHGHVHLTCGSALNGTALTYVFTGATRDGYSISPNSPHQPGDTFHITGGQTTRFSIVLDGPPPPNAPPTPSSTPEPVAPQPSNNDPVSKPAPATAPDGTLDIVTYEDEVKSGNEIGNVTVTTDQGGSGVQCDNRSGVTDPASGQNHGHVHIKCPAASGGGPRTYVLSNVKRAGYTLSGKSPHQIGDAFRISGNQTTTLSLVLKKNADNTGNTPQNSGTPNTTNEPNNNYTPIPVKETKPVETVNIGRIAVSVYKHDRAGQSFSSAQDERVGNVYVRATNIGVGNSLQCPDNEQRSGNGNGDSNPFGRVVFSGCPVATAVSDNHAKKYQITVTIPGGYEADSAFNQSVGAEKTGNSITRTITVRKNQTTDVSFLLVEPKVTASVASNPSAEDDQDPSASTSVADLNGGGTNGSQTSIRQQIVNIARRELRAGRTEAKQLSFMNSGYKGLNAYDPWCAFFVSYVYRKAQVTNPPIEGCSGSIGIWARQRDAWHPVRGPGAQPNYTPRKGDAVIFSTGDGLSGLTCPTSTHIALVAKVYSDKSFDSINGNWADRVDLIPHQTKYSRANGGSVLGFASPLRGD